MESAFPESKYSVYIPRLWESGTDMAMACLHRSLLYSQAFVAYAHAIQGSTQTSPKIDGPASHHRTVRASMSQASIYNC